MCGDRTGVLMHVGIGGTYAELRKGVRRKEKMSCSVCGKRALYRCGGCLNDLYCGTECADRAWNNWDVLPHGLECTRNARTPSVVKRKIPGTIQNMIPATEQVHVQTLISFLQSAPVGSLTPAMPSTKEWYTPFGKTNKNRKNIVEGVETYLRGLEKEERYNKNTVAELRIALQTVKCDMKGKRNKKKCLEKLQSRRIR